MIEIQGATNSFWLWWTLTLVAAIWQIWRAWRRPRESLGFATVASVLWLYIYCYLPYQLISVQEPAFSPEIWNLAQFTACISLLSLLAGWYLRLRVARRQSRRDSEASFDFNRLWWCGFGALAIGLVGFYSFGHSGREFVDTSAYWYLLFHTCYPGMALCVVAMALSPRQRSAAHCLMLLVLGSLIVVPLLVGARRGPTFVAIISLFFSFAAVRRRPIHPIVPLSILSAAGLLLLVLVASRRETYSEGGTWKDFLGTVTKEEVLENRARKTSDNEYFNHCQMLKANRDTGQYQKGTAHLAVFLNWVPRRIWPKFASTLHLPAEKPQRGTGFFQEAMEKIERDESSNLGTGGAWGAVADSFNNYWYFFPVFWLVIGWLTASVFVRAHVFGLLHWKLYNVGILCAAHWFIAQNFSEAFVPLMIYEGVLFIAYEFSVVRVPRESQRSRSATRSTRAGEPQDHRAGVSPVSGAPQARHGSRARKVRHGRKNPRPLSPPVWSRDATRLESSGDLDRGGTDSSAAT